MRFQILTYVAVLLLVACVVCDQEVPRTLKRKPHLFPTNSWGSPRNTPDEIGLHDFPESKKVDGFTPAGQDTYSGYIVVREDTKSSLFYMLHSPKSVQDYAPLIIWLQGGPGCSSVFGNLNEIGPIYIKNFDKTSGQADYQPRATTWGDTNHLLFIDSPIGVGFSPANGKDAVNSTEEAAKDLHTFIMRFMQVYPSLAKVPVYIFGESYAGHYVPAFAYQVWQNREVNKINFAGIGIGDGIIDPLNQIGYWDYFTYSAGLISTKGREIVTEMQDKVYVDILNNQWAAGSTGMDDILGYIAKVNPGINIYNFRQYNVNPDGFTSDWANHAKTKEMLGAPKDWNYVACNDAMYTRFVDDITKSFAPHMQALSGNIDILIYNGQDDIIINTPGQNNWLMNFAFDPSQDIRTVDKQQWKLNGQVVGNVVGKGGFYYAVVNKAGHMVPQDQGDSCRAMLQHFQNRDDVWTS